MFAVSRTFSYKSNSVCNTIVRAASFKVLKAELNYDCPDLKAAENKALNAKTVVDNLSNLIKSGGGKKGIHRHTVINKKLLVRHRLKLLFDDDSPVLEIGLFAGMCMDYGTIPAASSVAAIGKINGQFCIVGANDATVKGGTFFPISIVKQLRVQQLSYLNRLPNIYLVDSGGAYLPLQADIFPDKNHGGRTFYNEAILSSLGIPQELLLQADDRRLPFSSYPLKHSDNVDFLLALNSGVKSSFFAFQIHLGQLYVLQIALVCGSCTAGGAYCPTMAEEAIIVKNSGVIFLAGPPLVKAATGEIVTEQELGGADVHCRVSGCTDYYAENEEEAFEMCRESVLSLNMPEVPSTQSFKEPLYSSRDLFLISGKNILYKEDMYAILARILDGSMFKEFKQKFGEHLITGFGFVNGMLVGTLANWNPLTYQDAQKGSHFIQLCHKRNIPLVFLQNSGHLPDDCSQHFLSSGYLKDRAKMVAAHSCADVPKITINIGGCFSDDNFIMCSYDFEPNFCFSWPLAHTSSSRNIEELLQIKEKEKQHLQQLTESKEISDFDVLFEDHSSAFYLASQMMSDGIILPEYTRQVIGLCLDISRRKFYAAKRSQKNFPVFRM